jgi:hypothetical protein
MLGDMREEKKLSHSTPLSPTPNLKSCVFFFIFLTFFSLIIKQLFVWKLKYSPYL